MATPVQRVRAQTHARMLDDIMIARLFPEMGEQRIRDILNTMKVKELRGLCTLHTVGLRKNARKEHMIDELAPIYYRRSVAWA